jgi:hypothetical protein
MRCENVMSLSSRYEKMINGKNLNITSQTDKVTTECAHSAQSFRTFIELKCSHVYFPSIFRPLCSSFIISFCCRIEL